MCGKMKFPEAAAEHPKVGIGPQALKKCPLWDIPPRLRDFIFPLKSFVLNRTLIVLGREYDKGKNKENNESNAKK